MIIMRIKFTKKVLFFIFFLYSVLYAKNIDLDLWVDENLSYCFNIPSTKLKTIHRALDKNIKNKSNLIENLKCLKCDNNVILYSLINYEKISLIKYECLEEFLENSDNFSNFLSGIVLYKMHLYEKSNESFEKFEKNEKLKNFEKIQKIGFTPENKNVHLGKLKNFYMANSYIILQKNEQAMKNVEKLIDLENNLNYKSFFIVNFLKMKHSDTFLAFLEKHVNEIEDSLLKDEIYFLITKNSLENNEYEKSKYFLSKINFKNFNKNNRENDEDIYFLKHIDFFEICNENKNVKNLFSNKTFLNLYKKKWNYKNFSKNKNSNVSISKLNFLYQYLKNLDNFNNFFKYYKLYKSLYKDFEKINDEILKFNEITNKFFEFLLKSKKYGEVKKFVKNYQNLSEKFKIENTFCKKLEFYQTIHINFCKELYKHFVNKDIFEIYNLLEKYFLSFKEITRFKANVEIKVNNSVYKIFVFLENLGNKENIEISLFFKGFYVGKIFINKKNFEIKFDKKLEKILNLYGKNILYFIKIYSEIIKNFNFNSDSTSTSDFQNYIHLYKNEILNSKIDVIFDNYQNAFFLNNIGFHFNKKCLLEHINYKNVLDLEFFEYQNKFLIKKINIKNFKLEINFIKIFEIF